MKTMRLALPLAFALSLAPAAASAQTCASTLFGDGVCDCGCGTIDSDCPTGSKFDACQRSHCAAGQVPWEHQPYSCMASACGDGWADPNAGEACDDGNALASGGCSASCGAVNAGYACGERASGCQVAPADAGSNGGSDAGSGGGTGATGGGAGTTGGGAGATGGGTGTTGGGTGGGAQEPTGGCTTSGAGALAGLALVLVRRRRAS
jgi:cysteine-rich repeat protein